MATETNKIEVKQVYVGWQMDPALKPKHTTTDFSKDVDIIKYAIEDYVEKTGEGDTDYIVKHRIVVKEKKNRKAYIESFRNDVGILNVLKKVALTGDVTLLNQRPAAATGGVMDLTGLPSDKMSAYDALEKGLAAFASLPEEIKKKMSINDFVESFGQKEFNDYIQSKLPKKEVKEGE